MQAIISFRQKKLFFIKKNLEQECNYAKKQNRMNVLKKEKSLLFFPELIIIEKVNKPGCYLIAMA